MDWLTSPEAWIALVSLTALEIVLGIDNIIFISILVGRLPPAQRQRARVIGLAPRDGDAHRAAAFARLDDAPDRAAVHGLGNEISGRDLILIGGGLFLLAKSVIEIHDSLEGEGEGGTRRVRPPPASTRRWSRSRSSTSCSRSTR